MITQDKLLSFLSTQFAVDPADIDSDTELFTGGVLDSFSIVELVVFIECEENIKMSPSELVMENLDTIGKVLQFCETKRTMHSTPMLST